MPGRRTISGLLILLSLIIESAVMSHAQTRCVIADMETRVPIRNVKVFTNRGDVFVTDYTGQLNIGKSFESATISHVSYLETKVNREAMKDTLYLLPKENDLSTLYVWGKDRQMIKALVASATSNLSAFAPPKGVASFDFFEMFRKKPLNKKTRKKNEELLKNWDELYGKVEEKETTKPANKEDAAGIGEGRKEGENEK
jgi:hypothetical protein